ncbi:MAG: dTMP kinase [Methanomassiliicoccales archaeon]|nr:MAG: dTMP kinase [Methanomassiliicoccales archaeon]
MGASERGLLITIEGIDGVGKTTQAAMLAEFLRGKGYRVVELKEPTDGFWGKKIRNLTKKGRNVTPKEECQWFLKDRMEDVKNNINPALESGNIVIMDRYYYSNMAYQGALGLNKKRIREENEKFAVKPDLVIILDAPPETGLGRIKNQRNEDLNYFETMEYQKKVRELFLSMKDFDNVRILDGSKGKNEVQENIRMTVCKFFNLD